ncbi:NrtA/SsuA/CpmA family ABC transporter substrate-binding protein [Schlegelella sp. S2-27]|uniref:NrtA/SsuA/CpmA family ABC transporter substrate-binding protein n=1 Tax=Caldimonas mangrovi TaxID=2944811 RepID=A0ABT0YIA6_9BURK|nr:NrtA/SsuA/CpmA family ABC transporter substrate-binding protein [Caldimonas mangrovi]
MLEAGTSPVAPLGRRARAGRAAVLLAALSWLCVVGACGYGPVERALRPAATPAEKLSLAASSTPHAALLHLAEAKGYFADEGLDVTLVPVSHGKAAIDLLTQSKVDLAAAAEVPFVISVLQGQDFALAAAVASTSKEMAIVARGDRAISAPAHLAGKKVGVTPGTSSEYFLWAFLIRHRMGPDAVELVSLPPGRMTQALAEGQVDAVSTWEPLVSEARASLGVGAVSFVEPAAYTVMHVLVGSREFLKARSGTVSRLLRALLEAERFSRLQPREAMALAAQRLQLDLATLQPAWQNLRLQVDLRQSQLITLEDEARWARARGYVAPGAQTNFLPHLHLDALLSARPERVTVVH